MSTTEAPLAPHNEQQEVAKKPADPRPYVVLRQVKTATSPSEAASKTWEFVRNVEAHSAEQAVRQVAEIMLATSDEDKLTFVAIPARNFKPIAVSAEIQTRLKLG